MLVTIETPRPSINERLLLTSSQYNFMKHGVKYRFYAVIHDSSRTNIISRYVCRPETEANVLNIAEMLTTCRKMYLIAYSSGSLASRGARRLYFHIPRQQVLARVASIIAY